ncbi:MAG: lysophospholipid acyltransferase family protein [Bacteroidales bacterium]
MRLSDRRLRALVFVIFMLIYHVARYRRKTVTQNLLHAFPQKTGKELRVIRKKFFRHLVSVFHEVINYSKYDAEELLKRVHYTNPELLRDISSKGKNMIIVAGHCGNWELLGLTLPLVSGTRTFGAARRQSDPYFNIVINALRTRMGLEIIESSRLYRTLLRAGNHRFAAFLISDQSPPKHELDFWIHFLNQETPVFLGPEHIARSLNLPVIFAGMKCTSPGRYEVTFHMVCAIPSETEPFAITRNHVKLLEEYIVAQPECWLWSHRRWKHKKPQKA